MKKVGLLVLVMLGFAQVSGAPEDYSKMSQAELDTAFVLAVKKHHSEKIQELIQAGANVNTPVPYTWTSGDCDWRITSTALMYAVRHDCPNVIKALLKVKQKRNESLNKALIEAIRERRPAVVKVLIEGGADINYKGENGDTPLILAAQSASGIWGTSREAKYQNLYRRGREVIQILLKAGAQVSSINEGGRTALMEAVINHDLDTVLDLLKVPELRKGSFFGLGTKPINYADKDGNTALILAVKYIRDSYIVGTREYNIVVNSQRIVKELSGFPGIDSHHVNNKGETAHTLFKELRKKHIGTYFANSNRYHSY